MNDGEYVVMPDAAVNQPQDLCFGRLCVYTINQIALNLSLATIDAGVWVRSWSAHHNVIRPKRHCRLAIVAPPSSDVIVMQLRYFARIHRFSPY
jgi:hypothetical protein